MKEYMYRRYYDRKNQAIAYLGGVCEQCGTTDNLEFDHVDSSTKSKDVGKIMSYSKVRFWQEVEKCQLLCKDCHKEKTRLYDTKPWKHGTSHAWQIKKCRCRVCEKGIQIYRDRYNKSRRNKRLASLA